MIARPVRRVAFHRPRTRCLFAQVDSPRRAAPVVRAQRRHSRSVAFRVVCSAHRPIVRLLVLPRALKHLSYAPHRARFARWLGLGFLGWRTPDLRCEYNEQMGTKFFYVWVDDPKTPLDLESPGHGGHEKPPHSHHPSARSPDIGIAI